MNVAGKAIRLSATLAATLLMFGTAVASDPFPQGPVTLVVPYGPGGSTDLFARRLASELQTMWGQPVVVENRPGAGSMIGSAYVSQARPDGHTLIFNSSAHVTAPAIHPDLPFDPLADMTPIAMVSYSPFLIVAGSAVASETLQDLLDEGAERPMFMATAGLGSSSHFASELFVGQSGLDMDIVHYSGGGEALTDLMGGHADLYISSTAGSMAAVANGQVKPIGIIGSGRYDALPETQSTAEVGIEALDIRIWQGVFGPGSMDPDIVEKISADIAEVVHGASYRDVLDRNYTLPADLSLGEFNALVEEELVFWKALSDERSIAGN